MRKIDVQTCEMKRLFVRSEFQGCGIGKALVQEVIHVGSKSGYQRMRLDTVPSMNSAIALYRKIGFKDIDKYCENPVEGAIYLELDLTQSSLYAQNPKR